MKTSRGFSSLLALFAGLLASVVIGAGWWVVSHRSMSPTSAATLGIYTNTQYGFSFSYPPPWHIVTPPSRGSAPVGAVGHILISSDSSIRGESDEISFFVIPISKLSEQWNCFNYSYDPSQSAWVRSAKPTNDHCSSLDNPEQTDGPAVMQSNFTAGDFKGLSIAAADPAEMPLWILLPISDQYGLEMFVTSAKDISNAGDTTITPVESTILDSLTRGVSRVGTNATTRQVSFNPVSSPTFTLGIGESATDGAGGVTVTLVSIDPGQYPIPDVKVVSASSTFEAAITYNKERLGLSPQDVDLYSPGAGVGSQLNWSAKFGPSTWPDTNSPTNLITITVSAIDPQAKTVTFTVGTTPPPPDRG